MKSLISILCVIAIVFSLFTPTRNISALEKIDEQLIAKGPGSSKTFEIIVQLAEPTVVESATFQSGKIFSAREIMNPENVMTRFASMKLSKMQDVSVNKIKAVAPGFVVLDKFQFAFNGFYGKTSLASIEKIAALPEVKYVWNNPTFYPNRTRARVALGCETIWQTLKDPKGRPVDGSGMLVSITDSGLDYTHSDFGSQKKPSGDKIKISRDFAYNDNDCQEEANLSTVGHGTACAGIIAADGGKNKTTGVMEKGLAPKASLAGYKMGYRDQAGFSGASSLMAFEAMIKDKVDVSNNSYGAPTGRSPNEVAEENCVKAGIVVVASQGNEGTPGKYLKITSGNTSSPKGVLSVGALDDTEGAKLEVIDSNDPQMTGDIMPLLVGNTGSKFTSVDMPFEIVDCGWGRTEDFKGLDVKGKFVLMQRGPHPSDKQGSEVDYREKCINAAKNGARAAIIYNFNSFILRPTYYDPAKDDPKKMGLIPAFQLVGYGQGMQIRSALHRGNKWQKGMVDTKQNTVMVKISDIGRRGAMSTYSSQGPSYFGFLKPDVCAPADETHTTAASFMKKFIGDYWEDFNGTSSAGPMVAGCATLIKQGRPEWNAYEIKRALMNTAEPLKRVSGDYYVPMISQGMGRVNAQLAITTNLLIQPASTVIMTKNGAVNMTDPSDDLFDPDKFSLLPDEVKTSKVPLKFSNYSNKEMSIDLSYEVNSLHPERISVAISSSSLKIPPADGKGNPGSAWIGVNVDYNPNNKSRLNDTYIWAVDKASNRKWHVGICLYSQNSTSPGVENTYINNVEISDPVISPNGDGVDETLEGTYEVTCGNFEYESFDNYLQRSQLWAIDVNQDEWVLIREEPFLEMGPQKFTWDGKDPSGNYVLPDGDWTFKIFAPCHFVSDGKAVSSYLSSLIDDSQFTVEKSVVPTPPTLSMIINPFEPGVGQTFEVAVYLNGAKNVKSVEFYLTIPSSSQLATYMGYEKGDFMLKDDPKAAFSVSHDKDKETVYVSIQRVLDGVSGDGCLVKLKFIALETNFFDAKFSDITLTRINESEKEVDVKCFYRDGEISIYPKAYSVADFNKDEKVDEKDYKIILTCLGAKDGDPNYNWRYDLNFDRVIDFNDLSIFSQYYKK